MEPPGKMHWRVKAEDQRTRKYPLAEKEKENDAGIETGCLGPRHRVSLPQRETKEESMGIRRVTSSSPCLILVTRVERSLLKSASGASNLKFISVLDGMGMKLQSKPGG
eukprot:547057-Pelagomonas_calceolata.AAC.1